MNKEKAVSYVLITAGVFILHMGFYFFLKPIGLIIGGMMGISLLIAPYLPVSLGIIYLALNITALTIGGLVFGKQFFLRTIYATVLAPLLVSAFEVFAVSDQLLMNLIDTHYQLLVGAIAGGVLIGTGIGLVLRFNATTGGIDVYQKIINRYLKVPFSVAVYLTDGIIILFGMLISFQNGLFAIMAMLITAHMITRTAIFGRSAFALLIITNHPEPIKKAVLEEIDRGLTHMKVTGGYSNQDKELIITTVNRQQLFEIKALITSLDPKAFTLILSTKEVLGQGFHRDDIS